MDFDSWYEEVDNVVYAYMSADLSIFEEDFSLDLEDLYNREYTPMEVVYHLQELLEEELPEE